MNIKLYHTTDEVNKVSKTLSLVGSYDLDLLAPENVGEFSFTLSADVNSALINANYAYISSWGRYYFLGEPTILNNGYVRFTATIDLLMTHRSELLQENAIVLRQQNEGNLYIVDSEFPCENRKDYFYKKFPSSFSDSFTYYLTVGG